MIISPAQRCGRCKVCTAPSQGSNDSNIHPSEQKPRPTDQNYSNQLVASSVRMNSGRFKIGRISAAGPEAKDNFYD